MRQRRSQNREEVVIITPIVESSAPKTKKRTASKKKGESEKEPAVVFAAAASASASAAEPLTSDYEAGLKIVKHNAKWSVCSGLIPIFGLDLAFIMGIQLKMLKELSAQYDVPFSKEIGKSCVSSLIAALTAETLAKGFLASGLKLIPVVGQVAGAVGMMAVSGAVTYAIGKVFIQHFEAGGTFLDFDPAAVRAYFLEEYQKRAAAA